jgi:hypothetical protein
VRQQDCDRLALEGDGEEIRQFEEMDEEGARHLSYLRSPNTVKEAFDEALDRGGYGVTDTGYGLAHAWGGKKGNSHESGSGSTGKKTGDDDDDDDDSGNGSGSGGKKGGDDDDGSGKGGDDDDDDDTADMAEDPGVSDNDADEDDSILETAPVSDHVKKICSIHAARTELTFVPLASSAC